MLSVNRTEEKFILTLDQYASLRAKLSRVLKHDMESKAVRYPIRSLYFDSIDNKDYFEKMAGNEIRKKIRIRSYDVEMGKCKLEMKKKNGDAQHKIGIWISNADARELTRGNLDVLTKYFKGESAETALEIYTVMKEGVYRPVVMVEYDRVAFTYPMNNIRVTFDMGIRSSETDFDLFKKRINYMKILDNRVVLEVKYNGQLLGFISEILRPYRLSRTAVSKYVLSRVNFSDFDY